jgi:hypothetical protein
MSSLDCVQCSIRRWEFKRRTHLSSGAKAQYRFSDRWRLMVHVQSRTRGVNPLRAAEGHRTLVGLLIGQQTHLVTPFSAQ